MIKVALLGDSIRQIGYGTKVPELLGCDYSVFQPEDNCRFAKYTLRMLFDERENLKDCVPELNALINTYAHNGVSFAGIKKYYGKMENRKGSINL